MLEINQTFELLQKTSDSHPMITQEYHKVAFTCNRIAKSQTEKMTGTSDYNCACIGSTNNIFKKYPKIFNNDVAVTSAVVDRLRQHTEYEPDEGNSKHYLEPSII